MPPNQTPCVTLGKRINIRKQRVLQDNKKIQFENYIKMEGKHGKPRMWCPGLSAAALFANWVSLCRLWNHPLFLFFHGYISFVSISLVIAKLALNFCTSVEESSEHKRFVYRTDWTIALSVLSDSQFVVISLHGNWSHQKLKQSWKQNILNPQISAPGAVHGSSVLHMSLSSVHCEVMDALRVLEI
jgi:hypothetical protein